MHIVSLWFEPCVLLSLGIGLNFDVLKFLSMEMIGLGLFFPNNTPGFFFTFLYSAICYVFRYFFPRLDAIILASLSTIYLFSTYSSNCSQTSLFCLVVAISTILMLIYDSLRPKPKKMSISTPILFFSNLTAFFSIFNINPFSTLFITPGRLIIGSYWLLMVVGTLYVQKRATIDLNIRRKIYHFLSVLLFTPIYYFDRDLLKISLCGALSIFVAIEYLRVEYSLGLLTNGLSMHLKKCENQKFIVAHIQLLLGLAIPIWMDRGEEGLTVLGIGDSLASIMGMLYGKKRLYNGKTAEGCLSNILGCTLFRVIVQRRFECKKILADSIIALIETMLPSQMNDSLFISIGSLMLDNMICFS